MCLNPDIVDGLNGKIVNVPYSHMTGNPEILGTLYRE